ncbi:MBL fold metallo-hydrolase [Sporolituus thermophilus]|uniref:Glyoxylase, beta-lactamase superfamily II n=1 Tax=Sporolituus thermophilus DSM 23256 TaxID=1123285 RepID=A0A1G7JAN2_9FIRM|nr:MBL fold metallo-hydrolase [Sporolituus thermophilus]SDF21961.1 Glyoxylase, beta-lactamase superfamily II [Sporolituus thermophilus DSM 23256]
MEQVLPNLYRVEVPLPNNPLRALNSYLVVGPRRSLLIDTGLNREECREALLGALTALGIDLANIDFFITHLHADHSGLIGELAGPETTIYASAADAAIINSMGIVTEHWDRMAAYARRSGFPDETLAEAIRKHPGVRFSTRRPVPFTTVHEGYRLAIGDYEFTCITTPGHTAGHVCLYEPNRKILFSGDHILDHITPNISLWSDEENVLAVYLASLEKVRRLPVKLVLPGHRRIFSDCRRRIDELTEHHRQRLAEILGILEEGNAFSAYEVAARMRWDLSYPTWEEFPPPQKWFAVGEAIAHLRYLENQGQIRRVGCGPVITFAQNENIRTG